MRPAPTRPVLEPASRAFSASPAPIPPKTKTPEGGKGASGGTEGASVGGMGGSVPWKHASGGPEPVVLGRAGRSTDVGAAVGRVGGMGGRDGGQGPEGVGGRVVRGARVHGRGAKAARTLLAGALAAVGMGLTAGSARAQCYVSSSGVIPQPPDWGFYGVSSNITMDGGDLRFLSGVTDYAYFLTPNFYPFAWSSGVTITAEVRVNFSGQTPTRAGFYLAGTDSTGQFYGVGISGDGSGPIVDGVFLTNEPFSNAGPRFHFVPTNGFHRYTLRTGQFGAAAEIDGEVVLTVPPGGTRGADPIFLGDGSSGAACDVRLRSLEVVRTPVVSPGSLQACGRQAAGLTVSPFGSGPFTFQWRHHGAAIDPAVNPTAVQDTLVIAAPRDPDEGVYDCIVTSACGAIVSTTAVLTVCPADFTCDGFLDFFDYDAFVIAYETGDPTTDFNGDGFVDFFDYDDFVAAFEAGC